MENTELSGIMHCKYGSLIVTPSFVSVDYAIKSLPAACDTEVIRSKEKKR